MFVNATGYYIPEKRLKNDYFSRLHGLDEDWYVKRTGIISRARANDKETIDYMCIAAVNNALPQLPYDIKEVDLIVFASYTPADTVGTTAHVVQREFQIERAKAFYISSACSSAINAMEIIRSFFATGIATKALLISGDRNSSYAADTDQQSGHLWGDGATAFFFSAASYTPADAAVLDITTQGLGHIGCGPAGVYLNPKEGITMAHGKDVFTQACTYMAQSTEAILAKNNYSLADLAYFIGHQANKRIVMHVCHTLNIPEHKSLTNIEELGNTGCTSALLVYAQNAGRFRPGDLICLSAFGGGYSTGTCLLKIN